MANTIEQSPLSRLQNRHTSANLQTYQRPGSNLSHNNDQMQQQKSFSHINKPGASDKIETNILINENHRDPSVNNLLDKIASKSEAEDFSRQSSPQ